MRPVPHLMCWALGLAAPQTQTTAREREAVARYAYRRSRIVEVGVWHGVTTAVLRAAMAPHGALWAVDPFPAGRLGFSPQRPIAKRSVARVSNGAVSWIRETGQIAAERYKAEQLPPVDLVFLDGDHSYAVVMQDWDAWSPLVVMGGVICVHDSAATEYLPDCGSIQAVNEIVARDTRFERVEVVDTLTVLRRRA